MRQTFNINNPASLTQPLVTISAIPSIHNGLLIDDNTHTHSTTVHACTTMKIHLEWRTIGQRWLRATRNVDVTTGTKLCAPKFGGHQTQWTRSFVSKNVHIFKLHNIFTKDGK